jgi:cytochrome c oxidase subunit 2
MPPLVRRKLFVLALALGAALAAAAVAYAGNGGLAPVTPHSPGAKRIDDAYLWIAVFTGVVLVVVESALLLFIFRYRRRGRPRDAEGPQIHGATRLELIWTAIPVVMLAAIAGFVFYELPGIQDIPSAKAEGGPLQIRIDAHQFYWQFKYPNGAVSINDLHVPANRVVQVDIHSQDVDHSWWIPALQGKFDAIPGTANKTWFKADQVGTYRGQCGEFCGVYHATMRARVVAQSQSEYESYLSSLSDPLELGGQEWRGVCAQCHALDGSGGYGPDIKNNSLLIQSQGLRTLITKGLNQAPPLANYMPPVALGWSDSQVSALLAYLKARVYKGPASGG